MLATVVRLVSCLLFGHQKKRVARKCVAGWRSVRPDGMHSFLPVGKTGRHFQISYAERDRMKLTFPTALTLLFIGLKLGHVIDWSWWIVLLPMLWPIYLLIMAFVIAFVAAWANK